MGVFIRVSFSVADNREVGGSSPLGPTMGNGGKRRTTGKTRHTLQPEGVTMKNTTLRRLTLIISILLIATFLVSACGEPYLRIPQAYYFSPGGPFSTNITVMDRDGNPDPRRQIRCTIVFEVIDEDAIEELDEVVFIIRNAVLQVLGELTIEEVTVNRDLDSISQRLVDRINEEISSYYDLVVWAYFTDFALV